MCCRSVAPLRRTPVSKSSLCAYPRVLPRLRRINGTVGDVRNGLHNWPISKFNLSSLLQLNTLMMDFLVPCPSSEVEEVSGHVGAESLGLWASAAH